jgi:hypothetical protein
MPCDVTLDDPESNKVADLSRTLGDQALPGAPVLEDYVPVGLTQI